MADTPTPSAIAGVMTLANVMATLWERAADHLTNDELKWLTDAGERAAYLLANAADVAEGIGALVGADTPGSSRAGSFTGGGDTATLLFFLADTMEDARMLSEIGANAEYRLQRSQVGRSTSAQ